MAGWQMVDAGTARGLFSALRDLDWGWTAGEVPGVLDRLGWHLVDEVPERGAVARTPFDIGRNNVSLLYRGDRVRYLTVGVTDPGSLPAGLDTVMRADQAFDQLVAIGRELFGPPVSRVEGEERFAHWRGERATITVAQSPSAVFVEWAPNEYENEWLKSGTIVE